MMWVSARASLTAALSPDSGLRMEDLSILRRLAMEDATASLCYGNGRVNLVKERLIDE